MKKLLLILLVSSFVLGQLQAQEHKSVTSSDNYKNLDINNVDAYYMNDGRMFWDGQSYAKYEVPKGSGKTALFASGLWFSAESNSGVHTSVATFNTNGNDLFPGPLKATGSSQGQTTVGNSELYNKIWKVSADEIEAHLLNYQSNGYVVPDNIATWPAHGNTSEGYAENLAPFVDVNENGIYEPESGDYPCIKGDMALYWILNDNLEAHTEVVGSQAMGIEVHVMAYAFNCSDCSSPTINYTTFLNWKVINRSTTDYTGFNAGFWTDADLGYAMDDYVGTHVGLNSLYFYNGNDMDGIGNSNEYGENPPAIFLTVLDGPLAEPNDGIDNDNDGTVDEADEKQLLSVSMAHSNDASSIGWPSTSEQYNNYLNGKWKDDRPITFGGTGYQPTGGISAKYMFSGSSDPWLNGTMGINPYSTPPDEWNPEDYWTEENENNEPSDRRGLISIGPENLASGEELEYTMAIVWSRGDDGAMSSVTKGFSEAGSMINVYNSTNLHQCDYMSLEEEEIHSQLKLELFPNPTAEAFVIQGVTTKSYYKIYSIDGALIKEGFVDEKPINIKTYPKGVYIVEVSDQKTKQSIKLIKE